MHEYTHIDVKLLRASIRSCQKPTQTMKGVLKHTSADSTSRELWLSLYTKGISRDSSSMSTNYKAAEQKCSFYLKCCWFWNFQNEYPS